MFLEIINKHNQTIYYSQVQWHVNQPFVVLFFLEWLTGTATTTAAYKRWEKAAIAGVSLVADAAEHLERTSLDEVVEHVQGTIGELSMIHSRDY